MGKFFLDNDLLEPGQTETPSWINILIMMDGAVIDVDPSGTTAKGRWTTWLAEAMNVGGIPRQQWVHGYYENEYVKENGKWLFKKLHWNVTFFTSFERGWLNVPLARQARTGRTPTHRRRISIPIRRGTGCLIASCIR